MLRLLVDTSTWLDLAKRRDGQKWIVSIRLLVRSGDLEILVPSVVIDEFERNRPRIEASMTASVAERIRLIRRDFAEYGSSEIQTAIDAVNSLAHQVPLIGAMTTRNFDEILDLIKGGRPLAPSDNRAGLGYLSSLLDSGRSSTGSPGHAVIVSGRPQGGPRANPGSRSSR